MSRNNTCAVACSQHDPAQLIAEFQQPPTIDLQARKLHQRFALAPAMARAVAALAFAAEVRT
jgi:hypothetical protein